MFLYCGNSPINACDPCGNREEDEWSTEHDEQGIIILLYWLYGDGEDLVLEEGSWGAYMRNNKKLYADIISIVNSLVVDLKPGQVIPVSITTSAEIENGESIIGYQYLHGTNADAGGFQINGFVGKDTSGNTTYDIKCTWNDIIDPNFKYASDRKKASVAHLLPFTTCKDYKISITWSMKNPNYNSGGGRITTVSVAMLY